MAVIRHGPRVGRGALQAVCSISDDTDHVKILLAHRADPNGAATLRGAPKYYGQALALYHGSRIQSATPLIRLLADLDGLTPLATVALNGKTSMACALIEARAALDQGNWRGLNAQMIAEREGFPNFLPDIVAATNTRGNLIDSVYGVGAVGIASV